LLVTLRSNDGGRPFDVQVALSIAYWCHISEGPAKVFTSVQQLVEEFDRLRGFTDRIGQRRSQEIQVVAVPLPFSDPWDRLWITCDGDLQGQALLPGETLLVWQNDDAHFLVTGWNSTMSTVFLSVGERRPHRHISPAGTGLTSTAPRQEARRKR